jgi:hypothetical protein
MGISHRQKLFQAMMHVNFGHCRTSRLWVYLQVISVDPDANGTSTQWGEERKLLDRSEEFDNPHAQATTPHRPPLPHVPLQ